MRIKQRPEDFSVRESYRFDPVPDGRYRVYLMDKQKLSTFEAVERIRSRFGLRPGAISFCGLKDKQGRTEQLIAVDGAEVDFQEPDLRLKPLGRTGRPLSAENTTSNRFSVTVRALTDEDLLELPRAAAEVNRLGVVNYFDSQRFGSLKHGQGFIAKDLIRGDFEAALKNYLAKPSPLDRSDDAKVKQFWQANWGDWTRRVPFEAAHRVRPGGAIAQGEARGLPPGVPPESTPATGRCSSSPTRAGSGTRACGGCSSCCCRARRSSPFATRRGRSSSTRTPTPRRCAGSRGVSFPLLGPDSPLEEPRIREAVEWVLGKEKLSLGQLRIPGAERLLYFKHEERPILVQPSKLVLGRTQADELNRGFAKLNVAFTLPPGSYATLVVKRLFHQTAREDTPDENPRDAGRRSARGRRRVVEASQARTHRHAPRAGVSALRPGRPAAVAPAPGAATRTDERPFRAGSPSGGAPPPPPGFRARAKARKEAKVAARARQKPR